LTDRVARGVKTAVLAPYRWRYQWLRDSLELRGARQRAGSVDEVLVDLRYDVDDLIELAPGRHLHVLNGNGGVPLAPSSGSSPLTFRRRTGTVAFADCPAAELPAAIESLGRGSWVLVTNLSELELAAIRRGLPQAGVLGFHMGTGLWLLLGPDRAGLPAPWSSRRATPLRLGVRARHRSPTLHPAR
jgi:hypothetical protein